MSFIVCIACAKNKNKKIKTKGEMYNIACACHINSCVIGINEKAFIDNFVEYTNPRDMMLSFKNKKKKKRNYDTIDTNISQLYQVIESFIGKYNWREIKL